MRPLTTEESKIFFDKLSKFFGENVCLLIDRPDGTYCFRFHNDQVFYISDKIRKLAESIAHENLQRLGTCFGKFTKTGKFHLYITSLDHLAHYAKVHKVRLKSGIGKKTEATTKYQDVVVYSMNDQPLGCCTAAQTTQDCQAADTMTVVCLHQSDIGEYIRIEKYIPSVKI
uniref:60S ribosome subunit biogenesis protein NIP7 homolog n=1 Tax=Strigamia maritima TaxID=126957 RepID=T1JIB4_STRMM